MMIRPFRDRGNAGRALAAKLGHYAHRPDVVVLGLPRGGVPVAAEVTIALDVPMDIFIVRKLGTPGHKELAMGALASGGIRVINEDLVRLLRIPQEVIDSVAAEEQQEIERRESEYRSGRQASDLTGRTVILVDDGLATGASMHAAVAALRQRKPARIVVAVPVAPPSTLQEFEEDADEVVCVLAPCEPFEGVGRWYSDFSQTTDEEVRESIQRALRVRAANQT